MVNILYLDCLPSMWWLWNLYSFNWIPRKSFLSCVLLKVTERFMQHFWCWWQTYEMILLWTVHKFCAPDMTEGEGGGEYYNGGKKDHTVYQCSLIKNDSICLMQLWQFKLTTDALLLVHVRYILFGQSKRGYGMLVTSFLLPLHFSKPFHRT